MNLGHSSKAMDVIENNRKSRESGEEWLFHKTRNSNLPHLRGNIVLVEGTGKVGTQVLKFAKFHKGWFTSSFAKISALRMQNGILLPFGAF
ncbi:hypothetical protein CDAR_441901 [Caerostris darwini]|uniref:Uncharacterized protein n=1 Tax=Caerostris darwini TaxID=1538125 RepID=A0AAV4VX74_9ARAC|nr:hypothetical protein CDAR_441901 [Caerostris darwini]